MTTETQVNTEPVGTTTEAGLPPGVPADATSQVSRSEGAPKAPVIQSEDPAKAAAEKAEYDKAKIAEAEQAEAEAKKQEGADDKAAENVDLGYDDTADLAIEPIVDLLKEKEIPFEEADKWFDEYLQTGDVNKIDMKAIEEKLGKPTAELMKKTVVGHVNQIVEQVQTTVNAVHKEVGGKENYDKMLAWARTKSAKDGEFKKQMQDLNQLFDLNHTAAIMAGQQLKALYEKENTSLEVKMTTGDKPSSTNVSMERLSRGDYLKQVQKAHNDGNFAEVARLRSQRAASYN